MDDPDYFSANTNVRAGLNLANIGWAFTTGSAANWHPLTWISLMLDAQMFGTGPFGPHFVNLLLHAANTVLLFFLLRQLTAAIWKSALVAMLFALHPLHVESVAWISERKDVLSAFFGLISVSAYARYARERSSPARSRLRGPAYLAALFFFALSLMSKPMLVTLPCLLLLLDYWPLGRIKFSELKSGLAKVAGEKVPFFILSLLSSVATVIAQQTGGAVATLAKVSLGERIANMFVAYARYLEKTCWPAHLANPYPLPNIWPPSTVAGSAVLFIVLCAAAVALARKYPFGVVGWFWFAGMLVPTIGLVQVGDAAMADRYTYLPLIGIFIILAWATDGVLFRRGGAQLVAVLLALLMIPLCAWRTRVQIGYWQNTPALFNHAFDIVQNDFAECNSLGVWMSGRSEPDLTLKCFSRAYQMNPTNAVVLYNLGNCLAKAHQRDAAIDLYRQALQIAPPTANLLNNLGSALMSRKEYSEAGTNFEMALQLDSNSVTAHNNFAAVLFIEHRYPESAQHFQDALRLMPDTPFNTEVKAQIYANLGDALAKQGNLPEAAQRYQQALQRQPDNAKIKEKLRAIQSP